MPLFIRKHVAALLTGVLPLMLAGNMQADGDHLAIAAVPSIAPAAATLNTEFLRQHPGAAITVSSAASATLGAQIDADSSFDVLLADDQALPQRLAAGGKLDGSSTRVIGLGLLALWTNTPGVNPGRGRSLFAADYINRIAIADPASSPFGVIATTALDRLGVAEIAAPKLKRLADDLALAEEIKAKGSDIGLLPIGVYEPAQYTATLSKAGSGNALAQAYVEFLPSAAARALLAEAGFEAPAATPTP